QPGYFNPDQFSNELNVECHYRTTGQEILDEVPGQIGAFAAGVGTGGSLIGVAKALRERFPKVRVIAVEPSESAVMSGCGETRAHRIFGIGDGFIPPIAQNAGGGLHELIDEVAVVSSDEAIEAASQLRAKGYCVGISAGANYLAAKQLREKYGTVVTVFADGYAKYQSHGLRCADRPCCPHAEACKR
ncbi:MAG TPA: pyridoxal-phosphate dependent enzyme, partial [Fimbriimonadaceae bacterium]|nr:pyridoxal-phosphate dependent enzyme [Fimbriimonadaceae bacterium]